MKIYLTNKNHWQNGFDKRGSFWTFAFSTKNYGFMICKPFCNNPIFNIYKFYEVK